MMVIHLSQFKYFDELKAAAHTMDLNPYSYVPMIFCFHQLRSLPKEPLLSDVVQQIHNEFDTKPDSTRGSHVFAINQFRQAKKKAII